MDVACANSYTVCKMMHPGYLTLLDFKTIASTYLIVSYTSQSRAPTDCKAGSKGMYQYQFEQSNLSPHQPIQRQCEYCYKVGTDLKTYLIKCTECEVFLCLIKERNCYKKQFLSLDQRYL